MYVQLSTLALVVGSDLDHDSLITLSFVMKATTSNEFDAELNSQQL
jgi:hypothetical protein